MKGTRKEEEKKVNQKRYFSTNDEDSELKLKIYMMLSYYGSGWFSISGLAPFTGAALGFRRLCNEAQFNEFLTKYHLNEGALTIKRDFSVKKGRNSVHITEFRPDQEYGIMIRIRKEGNSPSYEYALPGFAISEIENHPKPKFKYLPIKRSDVQEALDLLLENRIMKQIGMFDGEMRYKLRNPINSNWVHHAISKCWELQEDIFEFVCYLRIIRPKQKKAVNRWFEFFYGKKGNVPVEQWLQESHRDRGFKNMFKLEEIEKCWSEIREEFEGIPWGVEPCGYFIEGILEYIYPHFMRNRITLFVQ